MNNMHYTNICNKYYTDKFSYITRLQSICCIVHQN